MALDAVTIFICAGLATLYRQRFTPLAGVKGFWQGTLIHGRSMGILLALLCGFTITLIVTSRRLQLYDPTRLSNILHEQRLSIQVCLTSGLLLTGSLYLLKAEDISRLIVLLTIGLVTVALSARRLVYRILLYNRFEHGVARAMCSSSALALMHALFDITYAAFVTWATHSRALSTFPERTPV